MYLYEVGKLYSSRTKWQELAQYNYRGGEHELILFLAHSSSKEVSDLQNGISEFALYVENDLIILLYRFGQSIDWSDAPFSIHLVPPRGKSASQFNNRRSPGSPPRSFGRCLDGDHQGNADNLTIQCIFCCPASGH